jgi:hypothetical protein
MEARTRWVTQHDQRTYYSCFTRTMPSYRDVIAKNTTLVLSTQSDLLNGGARRAASISVC